MHTHTHTDSYYTYWNSGANNLFLNLCHMVGVVLTSRKLSLKNKKSSISLLCLQNAPELLLIIISLQVWHVHKKSCIEPRLQVCICGLQRTFNGSCKGGRAAFRFLVKTYCAYARFLKFKFHLNSAHALV